MNKRIIIILFFLVGIIGFGSQVQASFSWENNLVAHWKMNDVSGLTVVDSSGNGYNGTAQRDCSLLTTAGKIGSALSFNGTSDYIDTGQSFQSVFQDSFSVSMWVNPTTGQVGDDALFHVIATEGPVENEGRQWVVAFFFWEEATETPLSVYYWDGYTNDAVNAGSLFSPQYNQWQMVTFSITKTSDTTIKISIYVNSQLLIESESLVSSMAKFEDVCPEVRKIAPFIGSDHDTNGIQGNYFKGLIDNVMLFDKALTEDEIAELYNSGNGTENTYTITGKISLWGGTADVNDVVVSLSGGTNETINPDTEGNYSFRCWDGYDYIITPSLEGYSFQPASYSYTPLNSDQINQDFIGMYGTSSGGGGNGRDSWCFIATAAYGTTMSPEVMSLREFRDRYLLTNQIGNILVNTYYNISPKMADFISTHPILKKAVRVILTPIVWMSRNII